MNSNETLDKLISLNVELEGILRVLSHRDNAEARKLAEEKFKLFERTFQSYIALNEGDDNEIHSSIYDIQSSIPETTNSINMALSEAKEIIAKAEAAEVKDQEAVDAEVETEMDAASEAILHEEKKEAQEQHNLNVEQMLARKAGEDLRKLFTINDRFRYARELFNGNMESLLSTLEKLNNYTHISEAENYLRDNLYLDTDNEEVKEFLEVIAPHYKD